MKVTMMLADAAQVANGKLFVLGGGWSQTGPGPAPSAIALDIKIPWDQANMKHSLHLELVDADGVAVTRETPDGKRAIAFDAEFEAGRPAGLKPGTPLDAAIAVTIPPQILAPGSRYEWRLSIDGHSEADWHVAFSTRPMPVQPAS